MKTLIALLTLAVIATATPVLFPNNIENIRQSNRLSFENSSQYREKKSTSPVLDETSSTLNDKTENVSKKDHLPEARNLGLKKPITIKKKFGFHRFRDTDEIREANLMDECTNQVKVPVCNEESSNSSNHLRATDISDQEMENRIKMAKEAVDILHRELHRIEESSPKSSDTRTSAIDLDLHNNVELARKALENIQQNFGDLEMNSREKENLLKLKASDEERIAQWREAIDNIQKNFEIAKNIEDAFKSNENDRNMFTKVEDVAKSQSSAREVHEVHETKLEKNTEQSKTPDKEKNNIENIESLNDKSQPEMDKAKNSDSDRLDNDDRIKSNMQTHENIEKLGQLNSPKVVEHTAESDRAKNAHAENKDHLLKPLSSHVVSDSSLVKNKNDDKLKKEESNDLMMKSSVHMEEKHEMSSQEKTHQENGNSKLFDTLSMRLAENNKHKEDMSRHSEPSNPKNLMPATNFMIPEEMKFKMAPTKTNLETNLKMPLTSRMPLTSHGHRQDFGTSEMNFAQNNLNVFQNQDNNMVDVNEHHTLEDPFFRRWAAENQRNDMTLHKSEKLQHLRSQLDDLHMGDREDLSPNPNLHNHMLDMHHHASTDNTMRPSMRMNMRNDLGKSSLELNAMQWQNQPQFRTSYGSSAASAMSTSSSSGDSGPGAVGIFPNAKVGGCAIPLLVSCSPSLVSGSLAKAHSSQSQPQQHSSYSIPNYRSGDDMVYYTKRNAKVDEAPVIKFQKTNTPLNDKTLDKNNYQ